MLRWGCFASPVFGEELRARNFCGYQLFRPGPETRKRLWALYVHRWEPIGQRVQSLAKDVDPLGKRRL